MVDPHAPDSVAVYRLYNVPGALLYVGIAGKPKARFAQHAASQPWWRDVARWDINWYPDRLAAETEEKRAIRDEVPAYNLAEVPAPEDERDLTAEWLATFRRRRPCKLDLDALFVAAAQLGSLGTSPAPRTVWTRTDVLDLYVYAKEHCRLLDVREHEQWVAQWNRDQEAAWRAHHGEAPPELLPVWAEKEAVRERVGMWLLGRRRARVRRPAPPSPGMAQYMRRAATSTALCTSTGTRIELCDCSSRHVVNADDEARYGVPIGSPIGRKKKSAKPSATV